MFRAVPGAPVTWLSNVWPLNRNVVATPAEFGAGHTAVPVKSNGK